MLLQSDLQLDVAKFQSSAISQKTNDYNEKLISIMKGGPRWYEVGAEKYRQMRWNGETPIPKPIVVEHGKDTTLPSRDSNRSIPCRVFSPRNKANSPRGIFLHIHGGGWVLQSEHYQDSMLAYLSDELDLVVISVGYRLAPEDPYPAANEDCLDVAEHLVDHAESTYGCPVLFMGGDSAGAHLSALTTFELLRSRPGFGFKGLVLNFGAYDLAGFAPQVWHFDVELVLDRDIMVKYVVLSGPATLSFMGCSAWRC